MKKTVKPDLTPSSWNPEALYTKSQRYVQNMAAVDSETWEYALWSSLSLEFAARAALANVSPALLADTDRSWASLFHALGFTPTEEKFAPKSIAINEVIKRLTAILPTFNKEHENFGILHTGRRNTELHSGELAFDGIKGSVWQPRFYETCEILLASMGKTLVDFVGRVEAKVAKKLIAAGADDSAKSVKGEIEAHKKVWLAKSKADRTNRTSQAALWATRGQEHRVECPACASSALVAGEPVKAPTKS